MTTPPFIAALALLLVATLSACTPETPNITGYLDPAAETLSASAALEPEWFVTVAQADLAEQLDLHPYEIALEAVETRAGGLSIVRLVAQEARYEYHVLGDTVLLVSDLSNPQPVAEVSVVIAPPAPVETGVIARLHEAGAWAEVMGKVSSPSLSVEGQRITTLNGSELHLFEYADAAAAEADAERLAPDAFSSHIYRHDRALLLYAGNDPLVLALLKQTLGTPLIRASR